MADEKLKIQIETEAGQAKEQISGVKKEVQEFGKVSDAAADDLKGLAEKIEDVGEESGKTAKKIEDVGEESQRASKRIEDAGEKQKKAGGDSKKWGAELKELWGSIKELGQIAGAVFSHVEEAVKSLADNGDKDAQALIGVFGSFKKSIAEVEGAIGKGLLPYLAPLARGFQAGAESLAEFVDKTSAGRQVVLGLMDVLISLLKVFGNVAEASKLLGTDIGESWKIIKVVVTSAISAITLGLDTYMSKLQRMTEATSAVIAAFNPDALESAFTAVATGADQAAGAAKGAAKTTDNAFSLMADSLQGLRNSIAAGGGDMSKFREDYAEKTKKSEQEQTEALKNQIDERIATLDSFWARARELQQQAIEEQQATQIEADQIYLDEMLRLNEEQAASAEDLAARNRAVYAQIEADESISMEIRTAAHKKMVDYRRADNEQMLAQEKATQAKVTQAMSQAAAQQLKAEQAKQLKMGDIVAQGLGLILGKTKDWGTQILTLAKKHAGEQLSVLQSQVVAEIQEYQMLSSKYGSTEATMVLQSKSSMAAKLASAFAPLGPFAVPATVAAIAAMSAAVNAVGGAFKFESGKASSGRPVGLGNADPDAPNAHVAQDETVLTGAQTRALGGSEAILAAAAGQGQQGGGVSGRLDVFVHHLFGGIPPGVDALLRPWMPALLKGIDEQVLRYRSKLTATHFLSARNPA